MDGHGLYGHFCSDFVKNNFSKFLYTNANLKVNIELAFIQTFLQIT